MIYYEKIVIFDTSLGIENKIYSNDILFALQQYVSNEENISLLDNIQVPKEGKEEII